MPIAHAQSMRFLITVAMLLALVTHAMAQDQTRHFTADRIGRLDQFVERSAEHLKLPGVAYALIENGEIVHLKTLGRRGPGEEPVMPDTPFELGSVSKSFTALALLQLQADGLLDLDDPVVLHVPAFRTKNKDWSDLITLRQLVSHRSGLPARQGNLYQQTTYRGADATELAMKKLRSAKVETKPGTAFAYSNANFALASHVIEVVTGQTFENVVHERIFEPLGMDNTYIQVPLEQRAPEAVGYRQWYGINVPSGHKPGRMMMAAAGVVSSAEDLAKYVIALSSRDGRFLDAESRAELFLLVPYKEGNPSGYALGWVVGDWPAGALISHYGLNGGYSAVAGFVEDGDYGFVMMTNATSALHDHWQSDFLNFAIGEKELLRTERSVWSILVTTSGGAVLLILGACLCVVRGLRGRVASLRGSGTMLSWAVKLVLPTSILFAIAYSLAVVAPGFNSAPLRAVFVFFPDLALNLGLGATAAVSWAVAGAFFRLKA